MAKYLTCVCKCDSFVYKIVLVYYFYVWVWSLQTDLFTDCINERCLHWRRGSSFNTKCNSVNCPQWGASAKCVHQVVTSNNPWCSSAPVMSGISACGRRRRWSYSIQSEGWSQCWSELLRHPEWLSFWQRHMTTGSTAPLWRHQHANGH